MPGDQTVATQSTQPVQPDASQNESRSPPPPDPEAAASRPSGKEATDVLLRWRLPAGGSSPYFLRQIQLWLERARLADLFVDPPGMSSAAVVYHLVHVDKGLPRAFPGFSPRRSAFREKIQLVYAYFHRFIFSFSAGVGAFCSINCWAFSSAQNSAGILVCMEV